MAVYRDPVDAHGGAQFLEGGREAEIRLMGCNGPENLKLAAREGAGH